MPWTDAAGRGDFFPTGSALKMTQFQAALFFGTVWKLQIIERQDQWMGIRGDPTNRPTFPQKGVTLDGKTYFRTGP